MTAKICGDFDVHFFDKFKHKEVDSEKYNKTKKKVSS